jgi:hypothetical protein
MFYYLKRNKKLAADMLGMLRNNNAPINDDYKFMELKAKDGALYVPFWVKLIFMRMGKNAGAGLYFDSLKTKEVFVFETPASLEVKERTEIHLSLMRYITGT